MFSVFQKAKSFFINFIFLLLAAFMLIVLLKITHGYFLFAIIISFLCLACPVIIIFSSQSIIEEKNKIIAQDSSYGRIVCRCEQITEGEIIRALTENPKAMDVDGVKRRTRAGMGRCQSGFCSPRTMEILARELNMSMFDVTKAGGKSTIVVGTNKDVL